MQTSMTFVKSTLETIHFGNLDRVRGGCGHHRHGDDHMSNTSNSVNYGMQYSGNSDTSYQAGGDATGSSPDYGASSFSTGATGMMALIQPVQSLVQALQVFEQALGGSTML